MNLDVVIILTLVVVVVNAGLTWWLIDHSRPPKQRGWDSVTGEPVSRRKYRKKESQS